MALRLNKEEVLKRTIPSIILFIAAFLVIIILVRPGEFVDSFVPAWLLGGFIWGWSLTKGLFPNFSFFGSGSNNSMSDAFGAALHMVAVVFRIAFALIVGAAALPVGIIITILTLAGIGKDAHDDALREAQEKEAQQKAAADAQAETEVKDSEIKNEG